MKLNKTARTILSVTALAWAIPTAQAESSTAFQRLDADRDGYLSRGEVRALDGYERGFPEADRNGDGRLDPTEAIMAQQLYERGLAARYTADAWITAKVKTALLREKGLDSMDVSVETLKNEVLLSGFVASAEQKRKALLVASRVDGVKHVTDGLTVRD
jgi:hyperosmotically inducible protein